jgi:hypothetical protein
VVAARPDNELRDEVDVRRDERGPDEAHLGVEYQTRAVLSHATPPETLV